MITIEYTDASGQRRRERFEPRATGDGEYIRLTERYTGCSWRTEGREIVQNVVNEASEVVA